MRKGGRWVGGDVDAPAKSERGGGVSRLDNYFSVNGDFLVGADFGASGANQGLGWPLTGLQSTSNGARPTPR